MLRGQINEILVRWGPKQKRANGYDPMVFLETPEQARKLLRHLNQELANARRERNTELVRELMGTLAKAEGLAKRLFRWEQNIQRSVKSQELREIKKLPLGL